jgi:hypothetical protein
MSDAQTVVISCLVPVATFLAGVMAGRLHRAALDHLHRRRARRAFRRLTGRLRNCATLSSTPETSTAFGPATGE